MPERRRRRADAAALGLRPGQVPSDHARQAAAQSFIGRLGELAPGVRAPVVVDLGCGLGGSAAEFTAADPAVTWVGLDVPGSPEAAARASNRLRFVTFDGERLPLADASAHVVYCKQVLEHVSRPALLFEEVARVLHPGGYFAGSTSQLEPYHSFSTGNHTPYGMRLLLERARLDLIEVRPGVDAFTLITRRALRASGRFDRWWERESPLNRVISLIGRVRGLDAEATNATKLLFAGQFCFLARRPASR